jgi:hypothetical protein
MPAWLLGLPFLESDLGKGVRPLDLFLLPEVSLKGLPGVVIVR